MPAPGGREGALRVEVTEEAAHEPTLTAVSRQVLAQPGIERDFPGADLWMVGHDVLDKDPDDPTPAFVTTVQDMASGRILEVRGRVDRPESFSLAYTAAQRPPSEDEFAWAVDLLAGELRTAEAGEVAYRPMPPVADIQDADGSIDRVISVGLRAPDGHHRIVGVRISDGVVLDPLPGGAQPSSEDCGAPAGPACPAPPGARSARVRVWDGEVRVWELVVVRPSASSGTNGSGVELRKVDHMGRRVLHRAHVPILNVAYGPEGRDAGCGPTYRDWLNDEACFEAAGEDPVAGFRLCAERPRTVLDSGVDGGGFRGVALFLDGRELVVTSQLQAGWYRYVSEWRLDRDGTIRPRFGFAAAKNPCTCKAHTHHAYWRLDFDVLSPGENVVQEHNDPPVVGESNWHTIRYEVRRRRDPSHRRYWRVRHDRSPSSYSVFPGPDDGVADDYGVGDLWVLRYREDEMDDGQGFTQDPARSTAQLDRFVSGEPVQREDLVLWYAAHFRHDPAAEGRAGAHPLVGPDLVPRHWVAEPAQGPLADTSGDDTR